MKQDVEGLVVNSHSCFSFVLNISVFNSGLFSFNELQIRKKRESKISLELLLFWSGG